jgi:hypothetical protein
MAPQLQYIDPRQVGSTVVPFRVEDVVGSYTARVTDMRFVQETTHLCYAIHPQTGRRVRIDPEQLWFWTPEWQAGEREVDRELQAGL